MRRDEFAVEFDYIGFWDLRFALADQYRNGRIFIAGDACQPSALWGYGINTGFEGAEFELEVDAMLRVGE